jgi:hypothetical protein
VRFRKGVLFAAGVLALCCTVFGIAPASAATAPKRHPLGANAPNTRQAPEVSAFATLPASVDLRQYAMPAGDQGYTSSCVTWAIQYGMMGWYFNKAGWQGPPFAPMYTYSQINNGVDMGTWPSLALGIGVVQGSDTRAHYSHADDDWQSQPDQSEHVNAANYKITGYDVLFQGGAQSGNVGALKAALAAGKPVAITILVRSGFDAMWNKSTDSAVDDDISGAVRGAHEVLALGYDSDGLVIQNSWGASWANHGFTKLSWRVVAHDVLEAETIDGVALAAPTVSKPLATLEAVGGTGSGGVFYSVAWTGAAYGNQTITGYDAYYQKDGGALKPVVLADALDTDFHISVQLGHTYRIAVRAKSATANGALTYGDAFRPTKMQETDKHISYSGTWAWANGARRTRAANAKANLVATGRRFSWVASVGPTQGSARIYVDGVVKATVSAYANAKADQQVLWTYNLPKSGSHTVTVVNLATPGHPYVDVDGFVVSS